MIERESPWRRPQDFFPAYDDAVFRRHLPGMEPEVFDTALAGLEQGLFAVIARSACDEAIQLVLEEAGLLRGACRRARVRATRWLAMTALTLMVRRATTLRLDMARGPARYAEPLI